jgi:hypothetical protein
MSNNIIQTRKLSNYILEYIDLVEIKLSVKIGKIEKEIFKQKLKNILII